MNCVRAVLPFSHDNSFPRFSFSFFFKPPRAFFYFYFYLDRQDQMASSAAVTLIQLEISSDGVCKSEAAISFRRQVVLELSNMFEAVCKDGPQSASDCNYAARRTTRFHSQVTPTVSIRAYFYRIIHYAHPSTEALINVGVQIERLYNHAMKIGDMDAVCLVTMHRLLGIALMVQAKFDDDFIYSNAFMSRVLGMQLAEVNQLEIDFVHLVEFNLWIQPNAQRLFLLECLQISSWPRERVLVIRGEEETEASITSDTGQSISNSSHEPDLLLPGVVPDR
jgi:hypothetical protein